MPLISRNSTSKKILIHYAHIITANLATNNIIDSFLSEI